jgi:hypothetical protein
MGLCIQDGPFGMLHILVQSYIGKIWKFANDGKNDKLHTSLLPIKNKTSLWGQGILCNKLAYFWIYGSSLVNCWEKVHIFDIDMVIMFCRCAN